MKKSIATFIAFIILIATAYSMLWLYGRTLVQEHTMRFVSDAAEDGLIFQSGEPTISGFPFQYYIHYSGDILLDRSGHAIHVPSLSVRSFFFADNNVEITLKDGFTVKSTPDEWLNSLDYFYTDMIIPSNFPADLTREGLQDWYNRDGTITFKDTEIKKGQTSATGDVSIKLDDNLQPDVLLSGRIYKAAEFVEQLQMRGYIEMKDQLFATTILSPLSREDEQTGEMYTDISLRLRNQSILVGPLQVGSYPLIHWPWRNPPARHL